MKGTLLLVWMQNGEMEKLFFVRQIEETSKIFPGKAIGNRRKAIKGFRIIVIIMDFLLEINLFIKAALSHYLEKLEMHLVKIRCILLFLK